MSTPSRYKPLWDKLKATRQVRLAIIPGLDKRIMKAVRKRRCLDRQFKEMEFYSDSLFTLHYSVSENGRIMTITLKETPKSLAERI